MALYPNNFVNISIETTHSVSVGLLPQPQPQAHQDRLLQLHLVQDASHFWAVSIWLAMTSQ